TAGSGRTRRDALKVRRDARSSGGVGCHSPREGQPDRYTPTGLFEGSKKHRVFMIVTEVSKAEGSATIARVVAEMDKRGLFQNVRGNRTQNAANLLHQLKKSRLLHPVGHGLWASTNEATE